MKKLIFALLMTSLLTACGDGRESKDSKLALGCQAGLKALLEQTKFDRQIASIKNKSFTTEPDGRRVKLLVVTKNKEYGYEKDENFNCLFAETSNILGYKAEVQQINIDENVFGKQGGEIKGDMNDFLNISGAVESGMR